MEKMGRTLKGVDMQSVLDSCAMHAAGTEFGHTPRCMHGNEIEMELSNLAIDLDEPADISWLISLTEEQIRDRVSGAYVLGTHGIRRMIFNTLFNRGWYGMSDWAARRLIVPCPVPTDDTVFKDPRLKDPARRFPDGRAKGRQEVLVLQAIIFNLQEIRIWLQRRLAEVEIKE